MLNIFTRTRLYYLYCTLIHICMYTKYNYTYKSMLFVLYTYTCMYTKYNYTHKSMFFSLRVYSQENLIL